VDLRWNEWFADLLRWQDEHGAVLARYPGQFVAVVGATIAGADPDLERVVGTLRVAGMALDGAYFWFVTRDGQAVPVLRGPETDGPDQ
jgi:hypothetical protein